MTAQNEHSFAITTREALTIYALGLILGAAISTALREVGKGRG